MFHTVMQPAVRTARPMALATLVLAGLAALLSGCQVVESIFGGQRGYLLQGYDVLAQPGERVELLARLQKGLFLLDRPDNPIVFSLGRTEIARAKTDHEGYARITWAAPTSQGEHVVTVSAASPRLAARAGPADLLVSVHTPQTRFVVTDLDHTVVAGGFAAMLRNNATPMPDSVRVLDRLVREKDFTIIYLTARPNVFSRSTRGWLDHHKFPRGPILLSDGALTDPAQIKQHRLQRIRSSFPNLTAGIGDRATDAEAYAAAGIPLRVLIPSHDRPAAKLAKELGPAATGVRFAVDWIEVERILFGR